MSMGEKVYTLDVSRWRCGGSNSASTFGIGATRMLNKEGYSCCLGQFSEGFVSDYERFLTPSPEIIARQCGRRYDPNFVELTDHWTGFVNTCLATRLMQINDSTETSPAEKIKRIRNELEAHGLKLRVLNEELLHPHKENRDQKGEEDENELLEAP